MKAFQVRWIIFVLAIVAILLTSGATLTAQNLDSFTLDPQLGGAVYESGQIDVADAEALFASVEAAVYFPELQRARWLDVRGGSTARGLSSSASSSSVKSLVNFSLELERDFPGFRSKRFGPYVLKLPVRATPLPAQAADGISASPDATVFTDSFENGISQWQLANNTNGEYNFTAMGCEARTGIWSADPVRGGSRGMHSFCSETYPANVTTQIMKAGCDAIQGASQAWLDFYLTADMDDTESIGAYYLAADGYIYGYVFLGTWSGWFHAVLNLKQWNHVGDLTTASCTKTIFQFKSDGSNTVGTGVFIDDVTIRTDAPSFLRSSITASPSSGSAPLTVNFVPNVSGASGSETYEWRFGDAANSTSAVRNATFTYSAAGDYWARLRVADGATRSYAHVKIQVTSAGACSLSCSAAAPATGLAGAPLSFQATAAPSGCSSSPTFLWNFGDGQTSTQQNPSHTYAQSGTYPWSLTVTSGSVTCTKNGSITIATTAAGRRRAVRHPSSPNDEVASKTIGASGGTISGGGVTMIVPAGACTYDTAIKIYKRTSRPPANFDGLQVMDAYEIQAGSGDYKFQSDVTIRMQYDPAAIRSDIPVERAISAGYWSKEQNAWVSLPATVDTAAKEIVVRTKHLSLFSWTMVKLGWDKFFKNNFYIVYNKAEVTDPTFLQWYRNPDTSNYADINVPNYIEDVMAFLIDAYKVYMEDQKFTAPSTPIDVYVGTNLSAFTEKITGIILISLLPQTPQQLKLVTAHELFHRVQNAYYYDLGGMLWLKWWLEATADYAGDRVAWGGLGLMGNKISHKYLEAPLTDSGTPHDEGYSTSHFLKFLVDDGANFKKMWDATANPSWFDSFSFLDGLTTYLQTVHGLNNGLSRQYQKFARYFVFDANSPMPAVTDSLHSEVAAYRTTMTANPQESVTFDLAGGYTAKLWGIGLSDFLFDANTPSVKYTVAVDGTIPAKVEIDVWVLKGDRRVAGGGTPVGTLTQITKAVEVEASKGDRIYVLAVSSDGTSRQVKVNISSPMGGFGVKFSMTLLAADAQTACYWGADPVHFKNTTESISSLVWTGTSFEGSFDGDAQYGGKKHLEVSGQLSADMKKVVSVTYTSVGKTEGINPAAPRTNSRVEVTTSWTLTNLPQTSKSADGKTLTYSAAGSDLKAYLTKASWDHVLDYYNAGVKYVCKRTIIDWASVEAPPAVEITLTQK